MAEEGEGVESWVQCDRCNKWRRVPKNVADALDEDAPWCAPAGRGHGAHALRNNIARSLPLGHSTLLLPSHHRYCEHNPLKQFASCKVAQELTDEEIDQEMHEVRVCGGARRRALLVAAPPPPPVLCALPPSCSFVRPDCASPPI